MRLKRLKQAWERDRLGVLGVGSALLAFAFWAFPVRGFLNYNLVQTQVLPSFIQSHGYFEDISGLEMFEDVRLFWFTFERQEAAAAFLALAVILLLLRRR
jgi:hypothetical protein